MKRTGCFLDSESGYLYTRIQAALGIARGIIFMTQTKSAHRIVIFRGQASENKHAGNHEPTRTQRTLGRRIVLIRNGESVGGRRNG
jgi:hypothetical protein